MQIAFVVDPVADSMLFAHIVDFELESVFDSFVVDIAAEIVVFEKVLDLGQFVVDNSFAVEKIVDIVDDKVAEIIVFDKE